jgi:L-threonylcarbamoyladenylate synthase
MTDWLPADHPDAPARAAAVIRRGGLIVLPTDTVYGVAADLWQPEAVAALYAAKQRPPDRAIPILLSAGDEIDQVAERVPEAARRLAAAFWPGPLTVVVPKRPGVPEIVSALPTVGVRVPDHDAARAAIRACGGALAVTSANLSDQPSALTAGEAADALGEAVGLVLDGGPAPGGTPSTVVDATGDTLTVLRPGPIDEAALRAVVEG